MAKLDITRLKYHYNNCLISKSNADRLISCVILIETLHFRLLQGIA